jgi:hypothetical protein
MRDVPDMAELHQFVRQETQCPPAPTCRRASTREGDQVGLLLAIEYSRTMRYGTTDEDTIKATLDKRTADPVDCDYSQIQSLADLLV